MLSGMTLVGLGVIGGHRGEGGMGEPRGEGGTGVC